MVEYYTHPMTQKDIIGTIRSNILITLMKVNAYCELIIIMNKSEIKLLFILLIWKLWMVHYSPKGINFYEILLYRYTQFYY